MDTFAFVIHPIDPQKDIGRKFPLLGKIATEQVVDLIAPHFPPVYISSIDGITSKSSGKQIKGMFVACPLTPKLILGLPEERVYRKIIETGRLAEKLGAQILGLGAFTSVVGDAGITIASHLNIPVTSGDSYTAAIAVQAVREAARQMGISGKSTTAAVVGATGAIGQVCAELLAGDVGELYLIGRRLDALESLRERISARLADSPKGCADLKVSTTVEILPEAHLILTVTSSLHSIIEPEHLRPGSVVCDVAQPRDVSARVAALREDILVIDGGMVDVPGPVDFHFDFGFPPGKAYACMAETMALALEGRFENYSLGKELSRARVEEIAAIAEKHGFRLSGLRSFQKEVTPEYVDRTQKLARASEKARILANVRIQERPQLQHQRRSQK